MLVSLHLVHGRGTLKLGQTQEKYATQIFQNSFKTGCSALAFSLQLSKDKLKWTEHHGLRKAEPRRRQQATLLTVLVTGKLTWTPQLTPDNRVSVLPATGGGRSLLVFLLCPTPAKTFS